jgi:hypothetical protein
MKFYYILCLKRTPTADGHCVWWKAGEMGYSVKLEEAGIYSEETIASNPARFNNGTTTRAIEADLVLSKAHTAVAWPFPSHE